MFEYVINHNFVSLVAVDNLWTPIPPKFDPEMKSHVDIMVTPWQSGHLKEILDSSSIPYEVRRLSIQYHVYQSLGG